MARPSELHSPSDSNDSGGSWLQMAIVVTVAIAAIAGVAAGLNMYATDAERRPLPTGATGATAARPAPEPTSTLTVAAPGGPAPGSGLTMTPVASGAPRPDAPPMNVLPPPTDGRPATGSELSVEDLVTRAVDAVVLVETAEGRGTAFFVKPDTLLTNVHVVGRNTAVRLRRTDGRLSSARVEATAPAFDLAVLRVAPADANRTTLPLGTGQNARVGQDVIAIGSALGTLQSTVTRGIVSAVRRSGDAVLVQTDAAVNPGNSGGPLLDRRGQVVGITTMGYADRQGLNFAVAIEHARPLIGDIPGNHSVDRQGGPPAFPAGGPAGPPTAPGEVAGLSPAIASDTDQARSVGARAYEEALKRLAFDAGRLEDDWQRYRKQCQVAAPPSHGSREWFSLLDPRAVRGGAAPGCADWLDGLRDNGGRIDMAMQQAEEAARRADVFPGARRDLRRRYQLDFDGWDR